jgi:hypothetical protein
MITYYNYISDYMICTYIDDIGIINSVGKFVTATQTKKGSVAFTIKDLR